MIGERLKEIREDLELNQKDVAKILKCNRSTYSLWEINKNTVPLKYLNKFSNEFNINIDFLAALSKKKKTKFNKAEINNETLGEKIKEARKNINYTQERLAKKLNTTHSVISSYENGKSTVSTLFLIEIAKTTKKSLNWFLNKIEK